MSFLNYDLTTGIGMKTPCYCAGKYFVRWTLKLKLSDHRLD